MTRLSTSIVTALLAKDSKDATYKFVLLRSILQCVIEQRAHKRIDEIPFDSEASAGYGQGAPFTREPHPPENKHSRTMKQAESASTRKTGSSNTILTCNILARSLK